MVDPDRSALLFTTGEKTTMQISGNFSLSGIDAVRSASRANAIVEAHSETKASLAMPVDQLELSPWRWERRPDPAKYFERRR